MQNRNNTIEERLQIINDYIQRTMDALNATRQVVQGLSASTQQQQNFVPPTVSGGITHSTFVPQLVQTPYGIVAINAQVPQQVPQVQQQFAPVGYGVNYGYGLQHTNFVPQLQGWPVNVGQMGVQQLGVQQLGVPQLGVPQVGMNVGWQTGLNHTPFVQTQVTPWGVPVVAQQWPVNQNVGFNPQVGVNQQLGVSQQQVVPQGIPTQTF